MALVQCSPDPTTLACREPTTLRFNIAGKITRSAVGFTQGLEFRDGKLYESTGFLYEGTLRQHVALGGKRYDLRVMGILREEFNQ